jgi:trimeric autotransporter adhesin
MIVSAQAFELRRLCVSCPAKLWPTFALLCLFPLGLTVSQAQISIPGSGIIDTVAGDGSAGFYGDGGAATSAEFNGPIGVAVDSSGDIYIADAANSRVREVIASTGIISTVAGNGTAGYTGDGGAATSARLESIFGIGLDASGNLYIVDSNDGVVREVSASTGIIFTVAGGGVGCSGQTNPPYDGCPATEALLAGPAGVALDGSGNLYIADEGDQRIRMVSASTGYISTVAGAGTAGYSGDGGPASSAKFNAPAAVAVDGSGNIYVVDMNNQVIREVSASTGYISTVAGNGTAGFSGDGGAATSAELRYPSGVAVDSSGNIYIADNYNHRIRKVTVSTGDISTVAGDASNSYSGDGGAATSAAISNANDAVVDSYGNIYIADTSNNVIRVVGH